jgi:hypothetical protein
MSRAVRKSCALALAVLTLVTAIPASSHADGRGHGLRQGNRHLGFIPGPNPGPNPGPHPGPNPGPNPGPHPGPTWHQGYGDWGAAAAGGAAGGAYGNGAYGSPANSYVPSNSHSSACAWQYLERYNPNGGVSGFQRVWSCY